mmetsp:Transcript_16772/g.45415  ORF Transcript_16772/g.45415 Transcript_16772/m.45415 type:complete len:230 (-) Transcript_16772:1090-1779(-)
MSSACNMILAVCITVATGFAATVFHAGMGVFNSSCVSWGSAVLNESERYAKTHRTFTLYPPLTPQRGLGNTSSSCSTMGVRPFSASFLAASTNSSNFSGANTCARALRTAGSFGEIPRVVRPKSDVHHSSHTRFSSVKGLLMPSTEMIFLTFRRSRPSTAMSSHAPPSAWMACSLYLLSAVPAGCHTGTTSPPKARTMVLSAIPMYGAPLLVPAAYASGHQYSGFTLTS